MPRIEDKAAQYLAEGRVRVLSATATTLLAQVHGREPYEVQIDAQGTTCNCPARVPKCAHISAVLKIWRSADLPERAEYVSLSDLFGADTV